MSRAPSFFVGLAGCTVLALVFASNAMACVSPDKHPKIKVTIVNGQPVADPDTISVCVDDTIHWVFAGGSKVFRVQFANAEESPFSWPDKSGASVEGTVRTDAVKGGAATPYTYNIEIDGVSLDPKIIVVP